LSTYDYDYSLDNVNPSLPRSGDFKLWKSLLFGDTYSIEDVLFLIDDNKFEFLLVILLSLIYIFYICLASNGSFGELLLLLLFYLI